jgi:hypothetical protein
MIAVNGLEEHRGGQHDPAVIRTAVLRNAVQLLEVECHTAAGSGAAVLPAKGAGVDTGIDPAATKIA